jgi:hypothetical protein
LVPCATHVVAECPSHTEQTNNPDDGECPVAWQDRRRLRAPSLEAEQDEPNDREHEMREGTSEHDGDEGFVQVLPREQPGLRHRPSTRHAERDGDHARARETDDPCARPPAIPEERYAGRHRDERREPDAAVHDRADRILAAESFGPQLLREEHGQQLEERTDRQLERGEDDQDDGEQSDGYAELGCIGRCGRAALHAPEETVRGE